MKTTAIVVTDGGRARFFHVQPAGRGQGGPRLVELAPLDNEEGRLTGGELFSNTKSGRNRAPGGGPAHGYDDHRRRHQQEIERRFAEAVARRIGEVVAECGAEDLVLVADPKMLGYMRGALPRHPMAGVTTHELAEDLSWHDVGHIQAAMVRHGLLAPERSPPGSYRPRGQPPV